MTEEILTDDRVMKFAKEIKRLRLQHGYTQQQLGEILGVQKSAIQKYENGTVKNIKTETFFKLCEIFNILPSAFLDVMFGIDELKEEVRLLEKISMTFGEDAVDLLEAYLSMNDMGREILLYMTKDFVDMEKYKK